MWFPTHTHIRPVMTTCNSSSRRSHALFWIPWALVYTSYAHIQYTKKTISSFAFVCIYLHIIYIRHISLLLGHLHTFAYTPHKICLTVAPGVFRDLCFALAVKDVLSHKRHLEERRAKIAIHMASMFLDPSVLHFPETEFSWDKFEKYC